VITDGTKGANGFAPNPDRAKRPWIGGSQRLDRHGMFPITSS
jgi:hypothetical protein